jgi:hypothetical protein
MDRKTNRKIDLLMYVDVRCVTFPRSSTLFRSAEGALEIAPIEE